MDIDLAEYDQVDEAKYFMDRNDRGGAFSEVAAPVSQAGGDLLTTLSSERAENSVELANCENDFVFLPSPQQPETASTIRPQAQQLDGAIALGAIDHKHPLGEQIITPDQLDIRSHRPAVFSSATAAAATTAINSISSSVSGSITNRTKELATTGIQNFICNLTHHGKSCPSHQQQHLNHLNSNHHQRIANPLVSINSNASNNPFFNLQQVMGSDGGGSSDCSIVSTASQACQPFWMRPENFPNKPIGLVDATTTQASSCSTATSNSNQHLSDLMHQLVTKSDSIFIAIPCPLCHDSKACPPSDISAWLSHMNRTHNCKLCPICNKLVGLGPMRNIEIMRKHVVAHIDDEWLERRSAKTSFSFGLQQQWFPSGRCIVKDPRTLGLNRS